MPDRDLSAGELAARNFPERAMLERTELHSREAHRGVAITIETRTDQEGGKQFAAHVPTPGHGYLGRYFDTPEEALAAARAHVDAGDPRLAAQRAETDEQRAARLALEQVLIDEQCWVELTRSQVADLLSMVQDRLAALPNLDDVERFPDARDAQLHARRSELLVLKSMLLLGRDDPGRVTA